MDRLKAELVRREVARRIDEISPHAGEISPAWRRWTWLTGHYPRSARGGVGAAAPRPITDDFLRLLDDAFARDWRKPRTAMGASGVGQRSRARGRHVGSGRVAADVSALRLTAGQDADR